MVRILDRRLLGPVKTQMGGDTGGSGDSGGGGGGGGSITINNNVSGHILKSIGSSTTISGQSPSEFPANTLLSGSHSTGDPGLIGDFSALYIDGVGPTGKKQRYQLVLSGGVLQAKAVDPR